jgi:hypothetical protein
MSNIEGHLSELLSGMDLDEDKEETHESRCEDLLYRIEMYVCQHQLHHETIKNTRDIKELELILYKQKLELEERQNEQMKAQLMNSAMELLSYMKRESYLPRQLIPDSVFMPYSLEKLQELGFLPTAWTSVKLPEGSNCEELLSPEDRIKLSSYKELQFLLALSRRNVQTN